MDPLPLVLFLLILPLFLASLRQVGRGARPALRPLAAYQALKQLLAQGAESGQAVHISIGVGGAGGANTVDTAAGLQTLEYLADRAAVSAAPVLVTVTDPTALPLAQDQLKRAYRRQGYPEEFDTRQVRWVAPRIEGSSAAYAAGAMEVLAHENVYANVMVGAFGPEFLLLSEAGAQRGLLQVGGTSTLETLPLVYTTMDHPLLGEEIYAGGAYLMNKTSHIGSLLAQDAVRVLLVVLALAAALLRTAGWI